MTPIVDLIRRLEAATGPDRKLDAAIFECLYANIHDRPAKLSFTGSIDAALTLANPDDAIGLTINPDDEKGRYRVTLMPKLFGMGNDQCIYAATLPLAICIASLRARAATERTEA